MIVTKEKTVTINIFVVLFAIFIPILSFLPIQENINYFRSGKLNETERYINIVNTHCPNELDKNPATKNELYISVSDLNIRKSIEQKMFTHCGAYCLFDYRNPTQGWYWNNNKKQWEIAQEIYHMCPDDEVFYATSRFLRSKRVI